MNDVTAPAPVTAAERVKLDSGWKQRLLPEFDQPYMQQLRRFLVAEKQAGKVIYPKGSEYFAALNLTPFDQVRVVILGQDPYHGPNQAHGLCFSVRPGIALPPSLQNIYKEIQAQLGIQMPQHGCLTAWAEQGVLLLNAVLSVEQGRAGAHQGKGWETFTDAIIHALNQERNQLVFMLWGAYAQKKGAFIDRERHLVLQSPHPSPLSAHRGFFGNGHFKACNDYLLEQGLSEIDWRLPANP